MITNQLLEDTRSTFRAASGCTNRSPEARGHLGPDGLGLGGTPPPTHTPTTRQSLPQVRVPLCQSSPQVRVPPGEPPKLRVPPTPICKAEPPQVRVPPGSGPLCLGEAVSSAVSVGKSGRGGHQGHPQYPEARGWAGLHPHQHPHVAWTLPTAGLASELCS